MPTTITESTGEDPIQVMLLGDGNFATIDSFVGINAFGTRYRGVITQIAGNVVTASWRDTRNESLVAVASYPARSLFLFTEPVHSPTKTKVKTTTTVKKKGITNFWNTHA